MPDFFSRLKSGWNAFRNPDSSFRNDRGPASNRRPDKQRLNLGTSKSIASPIYNQISIDVSSIPIRHVRVDQNGSYIDTMNSDLNTCLSLDSNLDQTSRDFMQDVVMSLFDEGCVAIVPVDTSIDPSVSSSYDIQSIRTGKILQWYPASVLVSVYNERKGIREDLTLPKKNVAIIQNPLSAIMNEPNSTLKRLIHKLNLLDAVDEQSSSGKLDLILQFPFLIKTETRKKQVEQRKADIEDQLRNSPHGIAYIDGTEKITQLNRPVENNLMAQVTYLTSMLHSQLGLTESIFNGTADEKTMLNYYNRTIEPILSAICDEMGRKFLTKTGRSQGQAIKFFINPFKFVPFSQMSTIFDTVSRNAILTKNEVRGIIAYKPSDDPKANSLENPNVKPTADSSQASPDQPVNTQ